MGERIYDAEALDFPQHCDFGPISPRTVQIKIEIAAQNHVLIRVFPNHDVVNRL